MKKVITLSLGGSLIIPEKINYDFLKKFKETILKNTKKNKFVIVCGGGKTARNYIGGLKKVKLTQKEFFQSIMGIAATRLNARFMTYFFEKNTNKKIPSDMGEIKNLLSKHDVVFCGALRYSKKETSDATATKLANYFKSIFINLTDVNGLYTKDPIKYKNAKLISKINWKEFQKMANKTKFNPGQHFVLDQNAAKIIKSKKITTYIIGPKIKEFENILNNKQFIGTIITN